MRMLADSGTPAAFAALVDIAGKTHGMSRVQSLELVARAHPSDATVGQMLADSLFSGRRDEAQYAAGVLGRMNTEDSRTALMAALTGKDKELAQTAAMTLGNTGMTESVKTALMSAAQSSPADQGAGHEPARQRGRTRGHADRRGAARRQGSECRRAGGVRAQQPRHARGEAADQPRARLERAAGPDGGDQLARAEPRRQVDGHADPDVEGRRCERRAERADGARPGRFGARADRAARRVAQRQAGGAGRRDLGPRAARRPARDPAARAADARPRPERRADRDLVVVQRRPRGRHDADPDRQRPGARTRPRGRRRRCSCAAAARSSTRGPRRK